MEMRLLRSRRNISRIAQKLLRYLQISGPLAARALALERWDVFFSALQAALGLSIPVSQEDIFTCR